MKIGFDAKRANANNTGLGNYSRFVISALADRNRDGDMLLYIPRRKQNREYEALLATHPTLLERLPAAGWCRGLLSAIWRTISIKRDLVRDGVEIFHGLSNEIPISLKKSGVRSVVTIHDLIFLRYPKLYKPIDRWIYNLKFRYASRNADRVIAVSECTKRDIVDYYGVDPSRVEVIYQGCAPHFAIEHSPEELATVRSKYSLPERYILNVGTLEERKNLLLCVKALENLPSDIHLVACGRATPYSAQVMSYAAERGLTDRITLLHSCAYADLPAIYQAAEVFIYPSRYEGFGIPMIEALSCGVPAIGATGSCLEEAGGDAAIYVDPDDVEGCTAAVRQFIEDGEFRQERIARGREYVKRFQPQNIAEKITELYRSLL